MTFGRSRGPIEWIVLAVFMGCSPKVSIRIFGESFKRKAGAPLPDRSSWFDGTTVTLRGARGETLGLQVFSDEAQTVSLELPTQAASVRAFEVESLDVREPSTSLYGESRGPGTYPDILVPRPFPVGMGASGEAFVDVAIRKDATPGRYHGELLAGAQSFPVVIDVEPTTIDLEAEPWVWVFYLPKEIARIHGVPDDDGPAEIAWERKYHELFRAHGAYLATDLGPDRFPARRSFVHGVRYWPVAIDISSPERIQSDVARWLSLFATLPVIPFAIPIDEPRTEAQRRRTRQVGLAIAAAERTRRPIGRPWLLRAVTAATHPLFDGAVDVYISPDVLPEPARTRLARGERFWTYNGRPPQAGSLILDTDGVALRTWGWIAYRYDVELWYAWEGLYFSDRYNKGGPTDVRRNPVTFDSRRKGEEDVGNGDGILAYPGPIPSLRLKALRRGILDRLLLRRLRECGGRSAADAIAERLVPRALADAAGLKSWPSEEAPWERARLELLDQIGDRCRR